MVCVTIPAGGEKMDSANEFMMVVEKDASGWLVGSIPSLPGCHTQGKTLEELSKRMKEAILLYLEAEDPDDRRVEFVGIHRIAV